MAFRARGRGKMLTLAAQGAAALLYASACARLIGIETYENEPENILPSTTGAAGAMGSGGAAGAAETGGTGTSGSGGTAGTTESAGAAGAAESGGAGGTGGSVGPTTECSDGTIRCEDECIDTSDDKNHCGACGHSCQTGDCNDGKCQPVTLASGRDQPWGIAVSEKYLYWVDQGSHIVFRMTLADGAAGPLAVSDYQCARAAGAVIVDEMYVYWAGSYVCRNLHGGGAEERFGSGMYTGDSQGVQSLALNSTAVYAHAYSDAWIGTVEYGIYHYQYGVSAIVANEAGLYWLERTSTGDGKVMNAPATNIDTSAAFSLTYSDISDGIAVYGGRIYWTARTSTAGPTGSVFSISTAGGSIQTIATSQTNPSAIAVDASGVYWTNLSATNGTVMHASLLGGDTRAIAAGQAGPRALALDSRTVYWTNSDGGQVMKLAK